MTIYQCSCTHEFQDAKYGKGIRVFNETANNDYRCTVCGQLRRAEILGKKKVKETKVAN